MCWKPEYALLLLTSTGITYVAANLMNRARNFKQLYLWGCIIVNLLILFFFKYYNFAAENITSLMQLFGIQMHIPEMNVLLPVGISFYIFQALGYTIDVYRGDIEPEKNFFNYALFVSFFPQLVAGPIERSTNILPQFRTKHKFDGDMAISGINLMLWGYFLKLVIADRCAIYVDSVYNNMTVQNGSSSLLASMLFCFQLYGDFAGYSYIAVGCARVMGFNLMFNFRHPYFFSTSVQDFWKRNHISLTTWFMDYLYYPMVGSSIKIWWWAFCIFITFFVSGFWHGAAWTYVMSFTIFGIYQVACTLKERPQKRFEKKYGLKNKEWWLWLNRVITYFLVMIALVFFRANTLEDGLNCVRNIFTGVYTVPPVELGLICRIALGIFVLFVSEYCIEYKKIVVDNNNNLKVYTLCGIGLIALILSIGVFDGGQFIYFQF
jgi:D-alanyl-lipoteichoic acid acyltransferase DltB (MBOAT superfamily)